MKTTYARRNYLIPPIPSGLLFLTTLVLFCVSPCADADIGSEDWSEIHDGGYGHDYMWGVAFDSKGNLYAAGYFKAPSTPQEYDQTAYIIKYPPMAAPPGPIRWRLDRGSPEERPTAPIPSRTWPWIARTI